MAEPAPQQTVPAAAAAAAAPRIDSRAGFSAAVRWGLERAHARAARRIVCVDPDFDDWPLDDPALIETLARFVSLPQRQLVLLATRFDQVPRRHPRFVQWRRHWSHAVVAFSPTEELDAALPTLLLDDGPLVVRLIDRNHWRGRASEDAREARLLRDEIDVVLQRSGPAFAVTELGL